jgi:hypothetical protein
MTLGDDKALPSINHQHIYVWMVHQYSGYSEQDPVDGRMKDQFMSVGFSGMFAHTFIGTRDTPIPGPEDSRWWLLGVAMMEGDWKFYPVNKLLPLDDTGSSCHPNNAAIIAAILPYLKRS